MASSEQVMLSYGEDPLTYDVLSSRLREFLAQLDDDTDASEVLIIYRPSFGRGMGAHKSPRQSTFGEFDAIVGTRKAVYFVESKWHQSSETKTSTVEVRRTQVTRHRILRWYRERWSSEYSGNWEAFVERYGEAFEQDFAHSCLPQAGGTLSRNIEFVLGRLESFPECVRDVVLFIGLEGSRAPESVDPDWFALVTLFYDGLEGTGYFEVGKQGSG